MEQLELYLEGGWFQLAVAGRTPSLTEYSSPPVDSGHVDENALSAATPPTVGHVGRPLPSLQQVEFGSVTMGWLDLAALALLGLLVARRARAAAATGLAAGAWGLLLIVTSPIAATPPVLAGLVAGRRLRRRPPETSKAGMRSTLASR